VAGLSRKARRKGLYPSDMVSLNSMDICYANRDDILFRCCVLDLNNKNMWGEFLLSPRNKKIAAKKHPLFGTVLSFKKDGQRTPVNVMNYKGDIYPLGAATRLSVLMHLGKHVNAYFIESGNRRCRGVDKRWIFGETSHFDSLSEESKRLFIEWREDYYERKRRYSAENRSDSCSDEFS